MEFRGGNRRESYAEKKIMGSVLINYIQVKEIIKILIGKINDITTHMISSILSSIFSFVVNTWPLNRNYPEIEHNLMA